MVLGSSGLGVLGSQGVKPQGLRVLVCCGIGVLGSYGLGSQGLTVVLRVLASSSLGVLLCWVDRVLGSCSGLRSWFGFRFRL